MDQKCKFTSHWGITAGVVSAFSITTIFLWKNYKTIKMLLEKDRTRDKIDKDRQTNLMLLAEQAHPPKLQDEVKDRLETFETRMTETERKISERASHESRLHTLEEKIHTLTIKLNELNKTSLHNQEDIKTLYVRINDLQIIEPHPHNGTPKTDSDEDNGPTASLENSLVFEPSESINKLWVKSTSK